MLSYTGTSYEETYTVRSIIFGAEIAFLLLRRPTKHHITRYEARYNIIIIVVVVNRHSRDHLTRSTCFFRLLPSVATMPLKFNKEVSTHLFKYIRTIDVKFNREWWCRH
jgi:hypothetical protein